MQLRVQFPSGQPVYGSIGKISYEADGVEIKGKSLKLSGGRTPGLCRGLTPEGVDAAHAVGWK